jgi:hypothetical protein
MMEIHWAPRKKTVDASTVRAESHGAFYRMDAHKQLNVSPAEETFRVSWPRKGGLHPLRFVL